MRGDRTPEVSRPTPGRAEDAGAIRDPASDPTARQRLLQPREPTGQRGRWVTATQATQKTVADWPGLGVRPVPTSRPRGRRGAPSHPRPWAPVPRVSVPRSRT